MDVTYFIEQTMQKPKRNYNTHTNQNVRASSVLNKRGAKLNVAFVDFRKAFDSVRHHCILAAIRKEGVAVKFAGAIRAMYNYLLSCKVDILF